MYDTFLEQDAWCYWVVSIAALLSFVGFIVACICSCRHNENKASSANRSLPDIPKDRNASADENGIGSASQDIIYEAAEIMGDSSELYATVRDKNSKHDNQRATRTSSQETSSLQEDDSASPYARLNSVNSTTDEHPYAQVQNVSKSEINRQNSFRNASPLDVNQNPSTSQVNNPVAPPRARRSSSHNSLLNIDASTGDIQAANAITGGVQANQDLPYMTPPILMSLPRPPQPQHSGPPQHFSGDSQDSKGYTSISVREPLANIIAQTKAAHQNRQNPRPPTDSHYATVSDDSDEMYAAIDEQEKIYTSGSETYAQIQPMISEQNRQVHAEVQPQVHQVTPRINPEESFIFPAPQPPSVDSLRHVAHAHSRQASSSSATSSIINPGSPKPEKRQANSPLPPPPPPLPPPEDSGDVYAHVDKHAKVEEYSNHQGLASGKSVEDMYAKVMKKKRDSEEESCPRSSNNVQGENPSQEKKMNLVEISRASWSSHDSVEIHKREPEVNRTSNVPMEVLNTESTIEFNVVGRKYELDRLTPEDIFEPINNQRSIGSIGANDPNYEMLRPLFSRGEDSKPITQPTTSMRNGIDVLPFYSVPFKHRQVSNASSEDPGYEKVRLRRRVDLDADTDSEPNYESMPHDHGEPNYASVCRPGDSDTDPNYESVHNSDPNYESVRYMSVTHKTNSDPPYEQVNSYKHDDQNIDGYEKVKRQNDDSNYEKIQETSRAFTDNTDTDDEQYVQV
ncbi:uncharacterized protein [Chelonus insularis]|uniref:uncharacterized protein isoform X2 n=1 Tax=Chelonus insularis TaxID=460826 RepID=UPI00158E500B|nr:uncharacterized protein LOC118066422 isoform X2 [Chelonus insularis]